MQVNLRQFTFLSDNQNHNQYQQPRWKKPFPPHFPRTYCKRRPAKGILGSRANPTDSSLAYNVESTRCATLRSFLPNSFFSQRQNKRLDVGECSAAKRTVITRRGRASKMSVPLRPLLDPAYLSHPDQSTYQKNPPPPQNFQTSPPQGIGGLHRKQGSPENRVTGAGDQETDKQGTLETGLRETGDKGTRGQGGNEVSGASGDRRQDTGAARRHIERPSSLTPQGIGGKTGVGWEGVPCSQNHRASGPAGQGQPGPDPVSVPPSSIHPAGRVSQPAGCRPPVGRSPPAPAGGPCRCRPSCRVEVGRVPWSSCRSAVATGSGQPVRLREGGKRRFSCTVGQLAVIRCTVEGLNRVREVRKPGLWWYTGSGPGP